MTLSVDGIWDLNELQQQVPAPPEGVLSREDIRKGTPPQLMELIDYAVVWGVSDDGYRWDLVTGASKLARWNLQQIVHRYDDLLEAWLAGPEAESETLSDAYIAFTAMRMASDEVSAEEAHGRCH